MKLLVLGGSGGTGCQIVSQALEAGHDVTVVARDPAVLKRELREQRKAGIAVLREAIED